MKKQVLLTSAITGALLAAAGGAASAQTLTMAVASEVTSLDPHYHNIAPNKSFGKAVFDRLVELGPEGRPEPGLALSWEPISDNVWEFVLRPDVTFHNGSEFTADDVVFTIERLPEIINSPGSFATYTYSIDRMEVVDPLTIRMHTSEPDPMMPVSLSAVNILDRETHEGITTAEFDSGEGVIGTGPFEYVSHRPGEVIELARNDSYWGEAPDWERVSYRMITNGAARVAALLSGDVDFINQPPTSDIAMLRERPDLKASEINSMRLMYLTIDQTGEAAFVTDHEGNPLTGEDNPLLDERVRRALSLAIDREMLVSRVMEGNAVPAGQLMPAGAKGYVPEIEAPTADPEEVTRLLTEAGYPDGFRLTLHGSNDRYPNDARVMQAVAQMWSRAGIPTEVIVQPYASYITGASRQEYSAFQGSWGSSTGDPLAGVRSILATYDAEQGLGSVNRARYSNPEYDALAIEAMQELDEEAREEMVHELFRIAERDTAFIPLYHQTNIWFMREGLEHEPRMDEHTIPQGVTLAEEETAASD